MSESDNVQVEIFCGWGNSGNVPVTQDGQTHGDRYRGKPISARWLITSGYTQGDGPQDCLSGSQSDENTCSANTRLRAEDVGNHVISNGSEDHAR